MPTSSERLIPSLVNVSVNGIKQNKCNLEECRVIVEMIRDLINDCSTPNIRSIGVISLIGDEQSRLIRNHLLDEIGPDKMKLHKILIGDPPAFQGTERDIIFLSMICSPSHVPTQCQLMHAQRINVAMSRAKDRLVLVRSINSSHVPNSDDVKIAVLGFFDEFGSAQPGAIFDSSKIPLSIADNPSILWGSTSALLRRLLLNDNYRTNSMGVVWHGLAVESGDDSGERCALSVEHANESSDKWSQIISQQRSIERVGWKCLRLNALSLLLDTDCTMRKVRAFLSSCGVVEEVPASESDEIGRNDEDENDVREDADGLGGDNHSVVLISSDEEDIHMPSAYRSVRALSEEEYSRHHEELFGNMRRKRRREANDTRSDSDSDRTVPLVTKRRKEDDPLEQSSDDDSL